jgi:hypothetical protein
MRHFAQLRQPAQEPELNGAVFSSGCFGLERASPISQLIASHSGTGD